MFDFIDDELRHQTVGDEFDAMFMHLREELPAVAIDKAYVREIDERRKRTLAGDRALPAFLKFGDTCARESPFNNETYMAVDNSSCDSKHESLPVGFGSNWLATVRNELISASRVCF